MIKNISLILLFQFIPFKVWTQDSTNQLTPLTSGISIGYGMNQLGIKDLYISNEKYHGYTNSFYLSLDKNHINHSKRIEIEYFHSNNNLENYTVRADFDQFNLKNIYLYPISNFEIFLKNTSLYLGPSTDFLFQFRQQNIANNGNPFSSAYSPLVMISAGANANISVQISDNFNLAYLNNISLLSLGIKMIDLHESDSKLYKLLTPFSGLNLNNHLVINYRLKKWMSITLGYKSNVMAITAWDNYYLGSDGLFCTLKLNFIND